MRSARSVPWLAVCKHCGLEITSLRGRLWWRASDFMCPDGESAHEPASVEEEEAS